MDKNPLKIKKNKRDAIASLLVAVNNQYRVVWDKVSLTLAVNCLEHHNYDNLRAAIELWMKESPWPPTIADLNRYYAIVQTERRRQEKRDQELQEDQELRKIKVTHERARLEWKKLPQETKEELIKKAIKHELSAFLKPETVAINILLFGEVKQIEDKKRG